MSYTNLREAADAIADRRDFQGNTLTGSTDPYSDRYTVHSYATPIAMFDPTDGTLYVIDYSYSVTTARHQSSLYKLASVARYVVMVAPSSGSPDSARAALIDAATAMAPEPV